MAQSAPETAAELRRAAEGVAGIGIGVRNVLEWVAGEHGKGGGPKTAELLHHIERELGGEVHAGFLLDETHRARRQYRRDLLRRLREQVLESELEALGFEDQGNGREIGARRRRGPGWAGIGVQRMKPAGSKTSGTID